MADTGTPLADLAVGHDQAARRCCVNVRGVDQAGGRTDSRRCAPRWPRPRPSSATPAGCCCARRAPSRVVRVMVEAPTDAEAQAASPTGSPAPWPGRSPCRRRARTGVPGSPPTTLGPMCGIVGYAGQQQALDVVVEGLRGWSTAATTPPGVAVVADGALDVRKKAGKLANLAVAARPRPAAARRRTGIGHTRWATHGGPTDRNAHPHVSRGRPASPSSTTASSRTSPRCAPSSLADGRRADLARPTPRSPRTCSVRRVRRQPRRPRRGACARSCQRLEGAFTLRRGRTPTTPGVVVGARRNSPLVVGLGEGENFLGLRRRRVHRAHPRRDRARPGPGRRRSRRTASTVTDFDGAPAEVTPFDVDWDAAAAEKGGYDHFMLKEIAEQPQAVADTLLGRIDADGLLRARRDAPRRGRAARRSTRSSSSPAARPTTPGWSPSTRSSTGRRIPVRGRAGQRVPLPRPGPRRGARWSSRSPSPARRWTR